VSAQSKHYFALVQTQSFGYINSGMQLTDVSSFASPHYLSLTMCTEVAIINLLNWIRFFNFQEKSTEEKARDT